MPDIIKSVSYSQDEIIRNILKLYVPSGKIDCDCTFSKGVFYDNSGIELPKYKFDILPQREDVIKADCRALPLEDRSIFCMMFDPPFLATRGKSIFDGVDNNLMIKRFGAYPTEKLLHQFYVDSLKEIYRVLEDKGILIFKCQDKVSSGKQYISHAFIMNEAVKIGFYPKDLFVLLAKSRIYAEWQVKAQKHSRKYHSYFWVFEKCDRRIDYID